MPASSSTRRTEGDRSRRINSSPRSRSASCACTRPRIPTESRNVTALRSNRGTGNRRDRVDKLTGGVHVDVTADRHHRPTLRCHGAGCRAGGGANLKDQRGIGFGSDASWGCWAWCSSVVLGRVASLGPRCGLPTHRGRRGYGRSAQIFSSQLMNPTHPIPMFAILLPQRRRDSKALLTPSRLSGTHALFVSEMIVWRVNAVGPTYRSTSLRVCRFA
jgi:hypothetical protein